MSAAGDLHKSVVELVAKRIGRTPTDIEIQQVAENLRWKDADAAEFLAEPLTKINPVRMLFCPTIYVTRDTSGKFNVEDVDWYDSAVSVDVMRGSSEEADTIAFHEIRSESDDPVRVFYEAGCEWASEHLKVVAS